MRWRNAAGERKMKQKVYRDEGNEEMMVRMDVKMMKIKNERM